MEIKTKFDIGQEVWLAIKGYRIGKAKITMIEIHKDGYVYVVDDLDVEFVFESEIFATKEEAEQKLKEVKDEQ